MVGRAGRRGFRDRIGNAGPRGLRVSPITPAEVSMTGQGKLRINDLQTPALVIEAAVLEKNIATMSAALPGPRLRPHVKAHKCTNLARRQAGAGHEGFTCAT